MNYSIIGSGHVGKALAQRFARSGVPVTIANTRGPESLAALALELGPAVIAGSLQDALAADIIILAVPFAAHQAVARYSADWRGKIVIDAMNFREPSLAPLGGLQSSDFVARSLPGAKVVKTFNQLPAALLASDPHGEWRQARDVRRGKPRRRELRGGVLGGLTGVCRHHPRPD